MSLHKWFNYTQSNAWMGLKLLIDKVRSCKFYLKTTESASKIKCSSSRTKTSEILKSYSHFKSLFLFHIGYTIYTYRQVHVYKQVNFGSKLDKICAEMKLRVLCTSTPVQHRYIYLFLSHWCNLIFGVF